MLPDIPAAARRASLQAALAALLLLTLAGVIWLGIAAERANARLATLANRLDALALTAETTQPQAPVADQLASLASDVATLARKLDALAGDEAKAANRLAGDVKTLTGRIDALAAARAVADKPAAKAAPKAAKAPPAARPGTGVPDTPQPPYYGPGYPAWPAY